MDIKEQLRLIDELSDGLDEIIEASNNEVTSFTVVNKEMFDENYTAIAKMAEGAFLGIKTEYKDGVITIIK